MYEQLEQLFGECDRALGHVQDGTLQHRQMHATLQDNHQTMQATIGRLRDAFTGDAAEAYFGAAQHMLARSRLSLTRLSDHADTMQGFHRTFAQMRDDYHTQVYRTMGQTTNAVWDFLGQHYDVPTLNQISIHGPAAAEHLLTVFNWHVPAQMPSKSPDPISGALQWTYQHTVGAITGALSDLFDAISSWGQDLDVVRVIVSEVGNIHLDFHAQLQGLLHTNAAEMSLCPFTPSPAPHYDLPKPNQPYDTQAKAIKNYLAHVQTDGYNGHNTKDIYEYLAQMNPAELDALAAAYAKETNGGDLYTDIMNKIGPEDTLDALQYRSYIAMMLAPDQVNTQLNPVVPDGQEGIKANPPSMLAAPGTQVTYSLQQAPGSPPPQYTIAYAIPDQNVIAEAKQQGVDLMHHSLLNSQGLRGTTNHDFTAEFPTFPGTYTIVLEVQYPGQQPKMYTYTQIVMPDASSIAHMTMDSLQMNKLDTQSATDYYKSLPPDQQAKAQYLTQPGLTPIPTVFVSDEGPAYTLQLHLFAHKTPNGWEIIDATIPGQEHVYTGATLDDAWNGQNNQNSFEQSRPWGNGDYYAKAPTLPGGTTNFSWSQGTYEKSLAMTSQQLEHEALQLLPIALGIASSIFDGPVGVFLAWSAAAAALYNDVSQFAQEGSWKWDLQHLLLAGDTLVNSVFVALPLFKYPTLLLMLSGEGSLSHDAETLLEAIRANPSDDLINEYIAKYGSESPIAANYPYRNELLTEMLRNNVQMTQLYEACGNNMQTIENLYSDYLTSGSTQTFLEYVNDTHFYAGQNNPTILVTRYAIGTVEQTITDTATITLTAQESTFRQLLIDGDSSAITTLLTLNGDFQKASKVYDDAMTAWKAAGSKGKFFAFLETYLRDQGYSDLTVSVIGGPVQPKPPFPQSLLKEVQTSPDTTLSNVPSDITSKLDHASSIQDVQATYNNPNGLPKQDPSVPERPGYVGYKQTVKGEETTFYIEIDNHTKWILMRDGSLQKVNRGAGVVCEVDQGGAVVHSGDFYSGDPNTYRSKKNDQPIGLGTSGADAEDAAAVDAATYLKGLEAKGQINSQTRVTLYLKQTDGLAPCDDCVNSLQWLAWKYRGVKITVYWYDTNDVVHVESFYRP